MVGTGCALLYHWSFVLLYNTLNIVSIPKFSVPLQVQPWFAAQYMPWQKQEQMRYECIGLDASMLTGKGVGLKEDIHGQSSIE